VELDIHTYASNKITVMKSLMTCKVNVKKKLNKETTYVKNAKQNKVNEDY